MLYIVLHQHGRNLATVGLQVKRERESAMTTTNKYTVKQEEAMMIQRIITAYSNAQTVLEQLSSVLKGLGLLKSGGNLDTNRVLEVAKAVRGDD